ncbi:hypothetical protein [Halomicrococcus sp. NG-SE-24]|uniref:hypothetical protein n=1 Tax=Halomicrococcus sp. NG-SE-24 TaxID=3436928 RepID=UPI003D973D23
MVRVKRTLTVLVALLAASFAVHYALFGSLPLGKPALLSDGETADELDVAESV